MRSELRTAIAVLATAAVLMGSATMALAADSDTPGPGPTETTSTASPSPSESTAALSPSPSPSTTTPEPTPMPTETTPAPEAPPTSPTPTGRTITDAQLRWGMNDESNNRAFAPGTFNFFSAGKIPDPGKGGVVLPQANWSQAAGNVKIEKYLNGAWTTATYAGLKTTSTGATMAGTNGPFSNHEVVISGGTGTVDKDSGTATIQWTGSFTTLYYSGYSFFYVTDPKLTVAGGAGTLTATLSGYASSMEDLTKWEAVPPVPNVVLADLGSVDLAADLGFSATPAYTGVAVSVGVDQVPQIRSGNAWGSFPQSFVDYQLRSGSGAYWYSSGGSADAHKVAKPVTVSYAAGSPVKAPVPATKKTKKTKVVDNDAPDAPNTTGNNTSPRSALASPQSALTTSPAPVGSEALQSLGANAQFRPASTVAGVRTVSGTSGDSDSSGIWILGCVLLASTALVTASPFAYGRLRRTS